MSESANSSVPSSKNASVSGFMRLPIWSIYSLILMTVVLSAVILVRIWFPNLLPEDMFMKIFGTYAVLVISSAVIAKMTEYIKNMNKG